MKKKYIIWAMICSLGIGAVFSSCSDYLSVEKFFEDRQNEDKIFKSKDYSEQWLSYCYNHLLGANIEIGTISQTEILIIVSLNLENMIMVGHGPLT